MFCGFAIIFSDIGLGVAWWSNVIMVASGAEGCWVRWLSGLNSWRFLKVTSCPNMRMFSFECFFLCFPIMCELHSLKLTAKAPENWWLEDYIPLGTFRPIFRGKLAVSFREGMWFESISPRLYIDSKMLHYPVATHTVDGKNPAPLWMPEMLFLPFFTLLSKPFRASQVVQDFFHQPY